MREIRDWEDDIRDRIDKILSDPDGCDKDIDELICTVSDLLEEYYCKGRARANGGLVVKINE